MNRDVPGFTFRGIGHFEKSPDDTGWDETSSSDGDHQVRVCRIEIQAVSSSIEKNYGRRVDFGGLTKLGLDPLSSLLTEDVDVVVSLPEATARDRSRLSGQSRADDDEMGQISWTYWPSPAYPSTGIL